jgi:hypothetical protein
MNLKKLLLGLFLGSFCFLQGQGKGSLTVNSPAKVKELQEIFAQEDYHKKQLEGYRVQIYNGRRDDCLKQRSNFLRLYPNVAAYTLYESPEYRIQVGDFRTRLEAEKFKQLIIKDFRGSFVLKTKIIWPILNKSNGY